MRNIRLFQAEGLGIIRRFGQKTWSFSEIKGGPKFGRRSLVVLASIRNRKFFGLWWFSDIDFHQVVPPLVVVTEVVVLRRDGDAISLLTFVGRFSVRPK